MTESTRSAAQQRTDDIAIFRRELTRLDADGVLALDPARQAAITAHHDALLAHFAQQFDIDRDTPARQLSLGMRIASFLGALALAASVYFLVRQFWGWLDDAVQVAALGVASLASLGLTLAVDRHDASGYFTKLAALVAYACFVLNIVLIGQIFNLTPSDKALLPWAAYAFLLAYRFDLRLLLAAGILTLGAYIAARVGTWSGLYWLSLGEWPEHFFPAALLCLLAPRWAAPARCTGFAPVYRVFGLLYLFLPILVLSNWGEASHLPADPGPIEGGYQLAGFTVAATAIAVGARRQWNEVVNTGLVFFVIFLYTKFFDWWWAVLPKSLFFLILGLTALLILLVLRRLRAASQPAVPA